MKQTYASYKDGFVPEEETGFDEAIGVEEDEGSNRLSAAYGPEKIEKLLALKQKYDPTNLFRMNQNISANMN